MNFEIVGSTGVTRTKEDGYTSTELTEDTSPSKVQPTENERTSTMYEYTEGWHTVQKKKKHKIPLTANTKTSNECALNKKRTTLQYNPIKVD